MSTFSPVSTCQVILIVELGRCNQKNTALNLFYGVANKYLPVRLYIKLQTSSQAF